MKTAERERKKINVIELIPETVDFEGEKLKVGILTGGLTPENTWFMTLSGQSEHPKGKLVYSTVQKRRTLNAAYGLDLGGRRSVGLEKSNEPEHDVSFEPGGSIYGVPCSLMKWKGRKFKKTFPSFKFDNAPWGRRISEIKSKKGLGKFARSQDHQLSRVGMMKSSSPISPREVPTFGWGEEYKNETLGDYLAEWSLSLREALEF